MAYPQPQRRKVSRPAAAQDAVSRSEHGFLLVVFLVLGVFLAVATGALLRMDLGGSVLLWVLTAGTSLVAAGCLVEVLHVRSPEQASLEVVRHRGSSAQ